MKKHSFTAKALSAIFIVAAISTVCSCGKPKDGKPVDVASGGEWILNGTTHKGTVAVVSGNQIMGNNDTTTFQLFFSSLTTDTSVDYKVVDEANVPANTLTASTCAFEINVGTDDIYLSKSSSQNLPISVVYSGGKYFAISFGTYKLDHYKVSSGDFVDSTSTCTLISLKQ